MTTPVLQMREIEKSFPGVKALQGVSLDVNLSLIHISEPTRPY